MVTQSRIIDCLKMYKISNEVIKFIKNTMENWRVELTARGKRLTKMKIQRGIFQRDALSPLLFVIAMPINHILRKCTGEYKLTKYPKQINNIKYMDDIKLLAKNKKSIGNPVYLYCISPLSVFTGSEDIQ